MTSKYKILFSVDILHDYYMNEKCLDFSLDPTYETRLLLKNSQLLYKITGNKLIVLAKVDELNKPVVSLKNDGKFAFYMTLNKPGFMNATNLDAVNFGPKRFYFTNLNRNKSGDTLNISSAIPTYNNVESYTPGEMADDGTGKIYENINSSTNKDPTDPFFWAPRSTIQYVHSKDMLAYSSSILNLEVPPANSFTIQIYGLNLSNDLYDSLVSDQVVNFDNNNISGSVQVNMSSLPSGKYKIIANGQEFTVYVDNTAISGSVFGVIEVFAHLPGSDPFSLLDNTGKVREVNYTLKFANRMAFWKYVTPRTMVKDLRIKGSNPIIRPFNHFSTDVAIPDRKDYFISKQPLFLSENKNLNNFEIELTNPASSDFPRAPKPDPDIPGMLTKNGEDYYCNMYLNY